MGVEAAALLQHISKRLPVDVLHGEIDKAVRLALIEDATIAGWLS